jgi:hypothetical protein
MYIALGIYRSSREDLKHMGDVYVLCEHCHFIWGNWAPAGLDTYEGVGYQRAGPLALMPIHK